MATIGVIGGGFVGRAVARGLTEYHDVHVYDVDPKRCNASFEDAAQSEFVFVCLPTPALAGRLDTSVIDEFFDKFMEEAAGAHPIVVIRSTVPVGYTETLAQRYHRTLHNPEFLTARCALADYQVPARHLIGVPEHTPISVGLELEQLYRERFPGTQIIMEPSRVTELAKIGQNAFFATKVTFWNLLYDAATRYGVEFGDLRAAILSDGRIAASHTQVPGHDRQRGFGGACLPKDTIEFANSLVGPARSALLSMLSYNASVRGEDTGAE